MNLISRIDSYAESCPDRVAHHYRESRLTYRQLKEASDALACYLIETLKDDRTPIVVYGHKQHEMLICFLACVKSGHAYIPVDFSLPSQRIEDIIQSSRTRLILSPGESPEREGIRTIRSDAISRLIRSYLGKSPSKDYQVKDHETYYIIYTSGSTGKPKGVQITLANLESFVHWGVGVGRFPEAEVFLNQAPFSFDLSVMDLYLALTSGSTLYSIDKAMIAEPKELFAHFKQSGLTVWVSTPSFAEMCLGDSSFNDELLPDLKVFMFCGETLSNQCAEKLYRRFPQGKVINSYGPTEATVAVTALIVDLEMCARKEPLPVGRVKEDCRLLIVDSEGVPQEEGSQGEIVILGASVSPGYYRNEEMTDKAFFARSWDGDVKRCYRTGDEGYLKEGLLHYGGRIDFQIKLNGYRIELEDIENNLRKVEGVANAIVLPIKKDGRVHYLAGVVVPNKKLDKREFEIGQMIKAELKNYLPDYMIPRKIMFRDSLPMTVNGKVNRAALMEEFQ
ncbi:D-alanine--poly(phosphoribitol) ligase subunit DltA [Desulfitobacterium hafniense]|uniref:D-alanine--D-alanyl carrier protein ligase n=2 Tax=root TaxID=1 RepID=A0A0W1JL75_DESHA|nr:D-alanine--poly(phosphoribitol) ligase subunit DltA [Desulfitobacterium hafniense]KTE92290.1 D-alanine--poly(phosphoribitol) ligase [Desulfitobacterium hafniense]MEA5024372.1 D-alanine--poly(phosphoribitol) ligase subunit DltA [Desulfitobacterium hafniense]